MMRRLVALSIAGLLPLSCKSVEYYEISAADDLETCPAGTTDSDNDGVSATTVGPCVMPGAAGSKKTAYDLQMKMLKAETPKELTAEFLYGAFRYPKFPSEIFAEKGGAGDSNAHLFLMRIGQQIFQQALMAKITSDETYANNVVMILKQITAANLRFQNNPSNPSDTNDNRYLEMGWFLALAARGAHIVDASAKPDWKTKAGWGQVKDQFNKWIGLSIDQNWRMSDALKKQPLDLVSEPGTMTWVSQADGQNGATNRTFSMLEALFRIAELRGGNLGPMQLKLTPWQIKQGMKEEQDGTIANLFAIFRGYLKYYFNKPVVKDPKELVLKYDPSRQLVNNDPEALNTESCGDPLKLNYKADCLINKDAYRNDTYHPQMGLASIMNIIDIGKRAGIDLTPAEHEKVVKGLRWASFNNINGFAGPAAYGIDVWELAFTFYAEKDLGIYCKRDLIANRRSDQNANAQLAWGYSVLAEGL